MVDNVLSAKNVVALTPSHKECSFRNWEICHNIGSKIVVAYRSKQICVLISTKTMTTVNLGS